MEIILWIMLFKQIVHQNTFEKIDLPKISIPNDKRIYNIDFNSATTRPDDNSSHKNRKREEIYLENYILAIQQQCPTIQLKDRRGNPYNITQLKNL